MKKKRILLLGGSGLLGYHCLETLSPAFEIFSTFNNTTISFPRVIHYQVEDGIKRLIQILKDINPDVIINTIALVTVDGCEVEPEKAYEINAGFVGKLVDAMSTRGLAACHLIQISTDSAYGQSTSEKPTPWKEDDPLNPLSVYAKTKLKGERMATHHRGPVTIIRTAFYGINPYSTKSLLWWIIDNAHNNRKMNGWENIYFSPVSARLLSKTIEQMINMKITGIFNVASNNPCTKWDFVKSACLNLNLDVEIERSRANNDVDKMIRPDYTVLDTSRLREVLEWDVNWEEDLKLYMQKLPVFPNL